jgi:hypothetical protein
LKKEVLFSYDLNVHDSDSLIPDGAVIYTIINDQSPQTINCTSFVINNFYTYDGSAYILVSSRSGEGECTSANTVIQSLKSI